MCPPVTCAEYAHADLPPLQSEGTRMYQLRSPVYANGQRWADGVSLLPVPVTNGVTPPPPDLTPRHLYGTPTHFPNSDSPGAVNVQDAPFFARGDGIADDTDALERALGNASVSVVFLPRGIYRVSRTLRLPAGKALVGVAHHLTVLAPTVDGFAHAGVNGAAPTPLVVVADVDAPAQQRNANTASGCVRSRPAILRAAHHLQRTCAPFLLQSAGCEGACFGRWHVL